MQPSAQWHHAQDAIPPAIPPRSRAVQRIARMPCLREFHACLAGTLLHGPYTSPYSQRAVNLGLFYHINNVIMRKPGWGQARPLAPALEKLLKGWTNMVYLRMLYGVLLLRVDCLLKAARYRICVGRERPDLSSPPWN